MSIAAPRQAGARLSLTLFLTPDRLTHPTQQGLEEVAQQLEEQPAGCVNCGGTSHEESMILCDGCDRG